MKQNHASNTRKLAFGGVFAALVVVILLVESLVPTSKLSLYVLSSFFSAVLIMEFGIGTGWAFYIATSLLTFLVIPDKLGVVPYLLFFGLYGNIKYHIEKIRNLLPEYILKYLFFNVCLAAAWFTAKELFIGNIDIKLPWWVLLIGLEVVFALYDYVYTLFIRYYNTRLKRILRI